ncbi:multidrug DMT transporter [Acinetobacter sp. NCu2D-2]|uniref:DMT family transporter n=1 Tax=Acinetobacter sp. NCu2D-2 TaxID=1608473 RepID=UPI0007CDFBFB|nr:DMT family transporter [Acinetobacter sp. NCu2D-2]ANF82809.1 multidrug DMT transporter [Acinetobacter sp. NCu2D-2]
MTQQQKVVGYALLLPLMAVLIWSLNMTINRYVADYISPLSISFYRWVLALLCMTPFVLKPVCQQWSSIRPHLGHLAVLSAFGMVFYQGLAYTAAHYTSATNMGLINAFIPVFTIIVGIFILKTKPTLAAVIGSIVSLLGLFYVIAQGQWSHLLQAGHNYIGDFLMLVAVFFYACYGIFLKKWNIQIPLISSLYIQICFAFLLHLPFVFYMGLDPINIHNAASIAYAGIFPSIAAPFLWMLAVQQLGPNRSSIFMNLIPVFTALIAYLWLNESWTQYHSIGGFIILIGILLAQYTPKPAPARL